MNAVQPELLMSLVLLIITAGVMFILGRRQQRRHSDRLQQRVDELEAMYSSSALLAVNLSMINTVLHTTTINLDGQSIWQHVCETATLISGAKAAVVCLSGADDELHLVQSSGLSDLQRAAYATLPAMPSPSRIEIAADVDAPQTHPLLAALGRKNGFRALIAAPLRISSAPSGWLLLFFEQPLVRSSSHIELVEMLAAQAGIIADNAELFQSLELYAFEMAQLAHLSRISTSNLDLTPMSADAARILCDILLMQQVMIVLFDPEQPPTLRVVAVYPPDLTTRLPEDLLSVPELHMVMQQKTARPRLFIATGEYSPALEQGWLDQPGSALVVAPMIVAETCIGLVLLSSHEKAIFNERKWQLLETATNQLATHIQNARLYTATRQALSQQLEQFTLIEEIARLISSSRDFSQMFDHILEAARRSTHADFVGLAILNTAGKLVYRSRSYFPDGTFEAGEGVLERDHGVIGMVGRTGRAINLADNRDMPEYIAPSARLSLLSSLVVPLIKDNRVIGVIDVESVQPGFFTQAHLRFMTNLADHAVIAITNTRLIEAQQYQVRVLASLQALAAQLSSVVDQPTVFDAILRLSLDLFDADEALLYGWDASRQTIVLLASCTKSPEMDSWRESRLVLEIARVAASDGEIQIEQSIRQSGDAPARHVNITGIPLKHGATTSGALCLVYDEPRDFSPRDVHTLLLFASQAAGHLENAALHEQIRAGHHRMGVILHSTRDGIILLDAQAQLVEVNTAARCMLGSEFEQYIAAAGWKQAEKLPPDAAGATMTRRRFMRQTAAQPLYLEEIGTPVSDGGGVVNGHLLVLRDVTEEKLLEDYRDEITSMVVHDLRGPLASVISGIQLVLDELTDEDEQTQFARQTLSLSSDSAMNLMQLISTLLDIAKLETRQMKLNLTMVDLPQLVDHATNLLSTTAQRMKIRLERDLPPDLPPVCVDPELIVRVLTNLLDNAIALTPLGSTIQIFARQPAGAAMLEVSIADSGPGIPVEERARIFEKFSQVNMRAERTKRGTGLGLAFCKLTVEAHGGTILVADHSPLPGACIVFTLPTVELSG